MRQPGNPPSGAGRSSVISRRVACTLFVALVMAIIAIVFGPSQSEIKNDLEFVQVFETELSSLQSSFTNQTDRFWRILKNRGLAHFRSLKPRRPLVLLLAAPPQAHDVVNCLATKLAEVLDPRNKRNLALVDGIKEKKSPGKDVKKAMDDLLMKKFEKGHRVALIQHLELLPFPSPLLFYSYCDDQNAPHKHVAIIFTVHLPKEPDLSLSAKEAEGAVETYLSDDVWVKEDQDAVAALLSRVADTVALMNGESSELVKTLCSN
ncbi:torsin-1A-interacting protein 2-like [Montipora foliosa]|uniref:torsin-1A-interacting protein 2-like n=1 Tax=Montipora foliosa TaxID=591990 RepID=UPI0035F1DBDF